jgi:zinc-finger of transposase IS204/IS1001/IS1096/IS1165
VSPLFPRFPLLHVSAISALGTTLRISACCTAPSAECSGCGTESSRVHSRYGRSIVDAAVGGQNTIITLTVRRFFCEAANCAKKTFAEQVPELTYRDGRSTAQLRAAQGANRLGAGRLCRGQTDRGDVGRPGTGRNLQVGAVRMLGVDDLALKGTSTGPC